MQSTIVKSGNITVEMIMSSHTEKVYIVIFLEANQFGELLSTSYVSGYLPPIFYHVVIGLITGSPLYILLLI
jgi:hypothetical protein